jgi:uncharacterized metal-binding protein YceD (DUF177 family)
MADSPSYARPIRVAGLTARNVLAFELDLTPAELGDLARDIGADAVRKLRFRGTLSPKGQQDWVLVADMGATVVQPCVVTLGPVTTRIDEPVTRTFLAHFVEPDDTEAEIPEDDTLEPLGPVIDPGQVLAEALALALPLYPRAAGVAFDDVTFTPEGPAPLDDKIRPFAALKQKLADKGGDGSGES